MRKYWIPILLVMLLLLSACGETADQPGLNEPEHLVFLAVEEAADGLFFGRDADGMLWQVNGEYDGAWACSWVRYTGEPTPGEECAYEITPVSAWYKTASDKALGGEAYDSVLFDHDGDGDEALLLITATAQTSEGQFCLQVWEGDELLHDALIYTDIGTLDALAFDYEDDKLVIRAVDWPYGSETWSIDTFRISWQEGGPVVSKMAQ